MSYVDAVLAHSPAVFWRLGEASGTVAADASGNGRHGTYVGGPTLGATGLLSTDPDTAVDFTPDDYVTSGVWQEWMGANAFTVIAVIKPDAVNSYRCVAAMDGSSSDRGWNLYVKDSKLTAFNGANPGGSQEYSAATSISPGELRVVAMTCTGATGGDTTRLYLDGVLDGTLAYGQVQGSSTSRRFTVGASWAGSYSPTLGFDGLIAGPAFIPSVLSDAQIAALAAAALLPSLTSQAWG